MTEAKERSDSSTITGARLSKSARGRTACQKSPTNQTIHWADQITLYEPCEAATTRPHFCKARGRTGPETNTPKVALRPIRPYRTHLVGVQVDVQISLVVPVDCARERRPRPLEREHALDVVAQQLFTRLRVQHGRLRQPQQPQSRRFFRPTCKTRATTDRSNSVSRKIVTRPIIALSTPIANAVN